MKTAEAYGAVISAMNDYYAKIASFERQEDDTDDSDQKNEVVMPETNNNEPASTGGNGSYDRVAKVFDLINSGAVGNEPQRTPNLLSKGYSETEIDAGQRAINLVYLNGYGVSEAINQALKEYAGKFFTGGYTGEWGNTGKLAILHEKELVLNATDTKNILDAISIIREISSAIDLRAAASHLASGLSSPIYGSSTSAFEQMVHITAEFPNAVDHYEIEEAFNNLINRASQYANRR